MNECLVVGLERKKTKKKFAFSLIYHLDAHLTFDYSLFVYLQANFSSFFSFETTKKLMAQEEDDDDNDNRKKNKKKKTNN